MAKIIGNITATNAFGEDGATFTPNVLESGIITWSNDKGLENPTPINIKGPSGKSIYYAGLFIMPTTGSKQSVSTGAIYALDDNVPQVGDLIIGTNGCLALLDAKISDTTFTSFALGITLKGAKGDDGVGINHAEINSDGCLVIINSLNQTMNLGKVVGPQGEQGVRGDRGPGIHATSLTVPTLTSASASILWSESGLNMSDTQIGDLVVGGSGYVAKILEMDSTKCVLQGTGRSIQGPRGPQGEQGQRGNAIHTTKFTISATGTATVPFLVIGLAKTDVCVGDLIVSTSGYLGEVTQINDSSVLVSSTGVYLKGARGEKGERGADGTSVTILGSYDSESELIAAHPSGDAGNAYLVNGDLYVWETDDEEWKNVGNIQGPHGESITITNIDESYLDGGVSEITFSDGNTLAIKNGNPGIDGVGINNAEINEDDHLVITLTDDTNIDVGVVVGSNGQDGVGIKNVSVGDDGYLYVTYDNSDTAQKIAYIKGRDGAQGKDGNTPRIGENGNWFIDNVDTGVKAEGVDGNTPYIVGGTWWIDNTNTNIRAEGKDGKSAYEYAKDGGYIGTETEFSVKLAEKLPTIDSALSDSSANPVQNKVVKKALDTKVNISNAGQVVDDWMGRVSVLAYKTASNSYTDAFKAALAANRRVFVPGGEYELNDTLLIGDNCELELSQDTVLKFTQTDKHGIAMRRLAHLKGNHATIFVPYAFTKNVIHAATDVDSAGGNNSNVPPFTTWDPQWKMSRYVTDINICKRDSAGFCYSTYGECSGTGLYIGCNDSDPTIFMWGVSMTGIRIHGAFTNGIHIKNVGAKAWNHDMRLEAVVDACETGALVENTNIAHLAITFQPRKSRLIPSGASEEVKYAKWGIKLVDCECMDLTQSTIWDWQLSLGANKTADQSEYQHIAMYGNCPGLVLGDFLYHADTAHDIRDIVYSENDIKYPTTKASNLATMTVLQEPITKWFKPKDGDPIFFNGNSEYKLVTQNTIDGYFDVDAVKKFEDLLPAAKGIDGEPFGNGGYTTTRVLQTDGTDRASDGYYGCTGLIPCKPGDTIFMVGIDLQASHLAYDAPNENGDANGDGMCRVAFLDKDLKRLTNVKGDPIIGNHRMMHEGNYYGQYYKTSDGCKFVLSPAGELKNLAYVRLGFHVGKGLGTLPMVSVNAPIEYTMEGFLSDNIYVKPANVDGLEGYINTLIDAKINSIPLASSEGDGF